MSIRAKNRWRWGFFSSLSCVFILFCSLAAALSGALWASQQKGIQVVVADLSGRQVDLYEASYALLIGVSDYTAGWPDLGSIGGELDQVEAALKKQGFVVIRVMNPDSDQLARAFEDFINGYGFDRNNRLLFFFSGHGHTRDSGEKGYLVPADAPNPNRDEKGFLRKALPMNQILAWSRKIEAKHALFLFDSCFSGTVFKAKDLPATPPHISRATALPVRQYITAGDAGETVPAGSVFTPAFIDALEYGWGDLNKDGYVSGSELGLYLQEKVPRHARQTPQWGKISDYKLARGDFIFKLASSGATVSVPVPSRKTTLSVTANVTGARVLVDGRYVGETPLKDATVASGARRLRVEAGEGYDAYERTIEVEPGRAVSLWVDLSRSGPRKARLYVETTPREARVRILNIGPVFSQGMELDPGRYHVEASAEGHEKEDRWVDLSSGEDETLHIRLAPVAQATTGKKLTNSLGMEFVYIPPGSFMMGSPVNEDGRDNDETQHRVTLSRGYYMQTMEVTQGQWERVMGSNPSHFKNCGKNCPVEKVSWEDCQEFIGKLNRMEGTGKYRLPTEAEWEYAARAGSQTRFFWGDDAECKKMMYENDVGSSEDKCVAYVRSRGLSADSTAPVSSYPPNDWGLYDMHGNVWEWCQDWKADYPSGSVTDPTGPDSGSARVDRGGGWSSGAGDCRSAGRSRSTPGARGCDLGFRLAFSSGQ